MHQCPSSLFLSTQRRALALRDVYCELDQVTRVEPPSGPAQEPVFDLHYADGAVEQGVVLRFLRRYEGPPLPLATWTRAQMRGGAPGPTGEGSGGGAGAPSRKRKAAGDDVGAGGEGEPDEHEDGPDEHEEEPADQGGGIGGPGERLQAVNRASQVSTSHHAGLPLRTVCHCRSPALCLQMLLSLYNIERAAVTAEKATTALRSVFPNINSKDVRCQGCLQPVRNQIDMQP